MDVHWSQYYGSLIEKVIELCPDARVTKVGPEGITFEYPSDAPKAKIEWGQYNPAAAERVNIMPLEGGGSNL